MREPLAEVAARKRGDGQLAAAESTSGRVVGGAVHARERDCVARDIGATELHAIESDAVLLGPEPENRKRGWSAERVGDDGHTGNRGRHRREVSEIGGTHRARRKVRGSFGCRLIDWNASAFTRWWASPRLAHAHRSKLHDRTRHRYVHDD